MQFKKQIMAPRIMSMKSYNESGQKLIIEDNMILQ